VTPRVALLSQSSFGSSQTASAVKMRQALERIQNQAPDLEVEGEMHGDAANITFNVLKAVAGQGITVGPILLGAQRPVHILTPTSTVRRITNMTALTSVDAAMAE
jgi:malate dehydrogenase (oxaloacetate-decarboxylating)(NADP+)